MLLCLCSTTFFSVVFLLNLSSPVNGWGGDGHSLVASIAQTLLNEQSLTFVRNHLPWYTSGNISMLASWPDYIIYPDTNPVDYLNWQWSKQLHFADTKDWACVYDREKDCNWTSTSGQQCVDGSIQNYTTRLADSQLDDIQRQEALKFLVHFIGDAHQPLHAGFHGDRGGNSIRGKFFGKETNLHSLWDTVMIERRITQDFHGQPSLYLQYLLTQMKTHYAQNISDWTNCSTSDESRYLACSELWIVEDAKLNCDLVYRDENNQPMSVSKEFTLGQTYYNTRMIIVEQRLIQGGVRLAAVINKITGSTTDIDKSNKTCFASMSIVMILFVHSILILILLGYTFLRRKRTVVTQAPVFRDKNEYLTIA
ncbi:unnamed protein product [Adineta steineri]|uniref:Aspergillus nuclease S(1) n=1 Tax=Adineta steineri TaxID=433720 RepID=A0A818TH90_9BILA|nr:unnamed protein product [Adineta steineri]CAF1211940.1 unnamed protein product [Adineta steineri]CAF3684753.1 unnamed protein product [Adineta steineri]CAF3694850.1 unnamed protein product [Adineta steineri]